MPEPGTMLCRLTAGMMVREIKFQSALIETGITGWTVNTDWFPDWVGPMSLL